MPSAKTAGCEKLPEGGMRENCEKKVEEGKEKEASDFRAAVIKLAHDQPQLRAHLVPALRRAFCGCPKCAGLAED